MVRCSIFPCVSHLTAYVHQGTRSAPLLQAHPPRRRWVYPHRLFSSAVLRWLPKGGEAARRRCPSHFQAVEPWSNFQHPTPVTRLPFHKRRSRNSSPSHTLGISCSVRLFFCIRFLQCFRLVLQDVGTRFQLLVPVHRRPRRCPCDQVSYLP